MENKPLNISWLFLMAWRDSRKNKARLFLFISSMILGIAALVAIYGIGDNLTKDIDRQAATLIGADLDVRTNKSPDSAARKFTDSLRKQADAYSEEQSFPSMILFMKGGGTRLVQIRALSGNFPFYGDIETTPKSAAKTFRDKHDVLVDKTLMLQYQANVGDSVQIGKVNFRIAGILNQAPGQTGFSSTIAPSVFMPLRYLKATNLAQKGSRINYNFYYKLKPQTDVDAMVTRLTPAFERHDLDQDTIKSKKESTGRSFSDVTKFLSLVGFIALLLGCIGVASAVHIYVKEKMQSIAILRCMGLSSKQAFLIFLIQITIIGFIGAVAGAALGSIIQQVLPIVFKDFLPLELQVTISWKAIGQGILLGVIISILFSLLPLISIRKVSPLNTIRVSDHTESTSKDPWRWFVYLLIFGFITCFARLQLEGWRQTLVFSISLVIGFIVLYGVAAASVWLIRKFFPSSWSYIWRQGLSNLYRPNNQTTILVLSIGLGTTFICTLFFVQSILMDRITLSTSENQPNMVIFDIQSKQRAAITELTKSEGLPLIQEVPIVTMRLQEINGVNAMENKNDSIRKYSNRAYNRELRVTFRDSLTSSERLIEGKWQGQAQDTAHISLEQGYAKSAHLSIGDRLVFNVQGVMVPAIVGSIREVDWNRVQTNFRLVFPKGVIDDAPQFHVLVTRVPNAAASAAFQQKVVSTYPNVSIIDLALILNVLDEILNKIGFVIRFMASFSIITGLIVLISSVLISKYQRMQESVLLRTIGASSLQVFMITALEYFFLGSIAAFTGIVLALIGNWGLAKFSFEVPFSPDWLTVVSIFFSISLLTTLIGVLNSRSALNRPPLEILRKNA
ncbi:permease [Pedobacter quisquiliarum]|uniref:Permease n=1 Tax=Pedobacter quisquiliarum TaxID=1834438 RepID=A0A916U506_9SPHI|nr:FtsX-like permease family protein [Pedobacter quisquiliarum]GGC60549.1 permease [Pedobacter quisquiliarum]